MEFIFFAVVTAVFMYYLKTLLPRKAKERLQIHRINGDMYAVYDADRESYVSANFSADSFAYWGSLPKHVKKYCCVDSLEKAEKIKKEFEKCIKFDVEVL